MSKIKQVESEKDRKAVDTIFNNECGVYAWEIPGFDISICESDEWTLVKVGMTAQKKGFKKRVTTELQEANTWGCDEKYTKDNIVFLLQGLDYIGHEKEIRQKLGIEIGVGKLHMSKSESTLNSFLSTHPNETVETLCFKNKKLKVRTWSLWLNNKCAKARKTNIGPSELIIMRKKDVESLKNQFYLKPECFKLDDFVAVKTKIEVDEKLTIQHTQKKDFHGPLIFGVN